MMGYNLDTLLKQNLLTIKEYSVLEKNVRLAFYFFQMLL